MWQRNILIQCNTVYQLIVALQLCNTIFNSDKCDIFYRPSSIYEGLKND